MEDARDDLPPYVVGGPAEHGAVVHLALGRVGEERGRALVGVALPGEVHAARGRVEGPAEGGGGGEGVDAAGDVSGLALGRAVDRLLALQADGLVWKTIRAFL